MYDNTQKYAALPLGHQIRRLRLARGWTLAELARRAGTSAPAVHRYENGWDRFEVATLRRIAAILGATLEVRLVPAEAPPCGSREPKAVVGLLAPLFWERDLKETDLDRYPDWVLARVLMFGNREQVAAVRCHFGDAAILHAVGRRGVDPRTRNYWRLLLEKADDAPKSPER